MEGEGRTEQDNGERRRKESEEGARREGRRREEEGRKKLSLPSGILDAILNTALLHKFGNDQQKWIIRGRF
jgi:hypothetical protein